ncbi:MAG: hypothetical protein O7H41_07145 [Planctomycetota bacterium]|nr:hypothetical protein [Planctomycetota bacterium]
MRSMITAAAMIAAALALPCAADTVVLKDGRRLEGKVESEDGETILLILHYGKMTIQKSDIVSIEKGPTAEEVYQERASKLSEDDLQGRVDLAKWCIENDLHREGRWEYTRVLEIDSDHADARAALDFVRHEGKWITRNEHREITRYPWAREMRQRLQERKVTMKFTRADLVTILKELARQTEETFRLVRAPKLEKFRMTYLVEERAATDVLEDFVRNVRNLDYVFTERGVLVTSRSEARKIRRKYGMPNPVRPKTREETLAALQVRHLTLLFMKKPLPWVIRYLETLSGFTIVLDAAHSTRPLSYNCTSKPMARILDEILTPRGLRYEIVGSSIVIKPQRSR